MRIFFLIIIIALIGWVGYILYMNKSRFLPNKKNDMAKIDEEQRLRQELETLQGKYDFLLKLCSSDTSETSEPEAGQSPNYTENESADSRIKELVSENRELRREIDQLKATYKTKTKTANTNKNNEKNIPIARNSDAAELQRFLTELYGDR